MGQGAERQAPETATCWGITEHGRLHFRPEDERKANRIDPTHTSTPLMCPPPKPAADGAATETAAVATTHLSRQGPSSSRYATWQRQPARQEPATGARCLKVSSESCACWLGKGFSADDLISSGQVSVELLHDGRALYFFVCRARSPDTRSVLSLNYAVSVHPPQPVAQSYTTNRLEYCSTTK